MIHESWPWKRELSKDADVIQRWAPRRPSIRRDSTIEKKCLVGAFIMRKLAESKKLTDALVHSTISCSTAPLTERIPDHFNWHRIDEFYDLARSSDSHLAFIEYCNTMVHSYVLLFEEEEADRSITAIYCASDYQRKHRLYRIPIDSIIALMRSVASDDVSRVIAKRDAKGQWNLELS